VGDVTERTVTWRPARSGRALIEGMEPANLGGRLDHVLILNEAHLRRLLRAAGTFRWPEEEASSR
jgi:branched-subunit amino acid aminotransferase/4-amino-4-deoxychorismate lyase